ncbi:hypothetical protein Tco_1522063, partial [Tanacetum coccineum]
LAHSKGLILSLLNLVLRRLTISNRYISMVLSFLRTMPPSVEESMAFMAKNLAKLNAINTLHNEQLAASHAKLILINKELVTANERLSALISNTVEPVQTVALFFTASSSSITKIENNVGSQSHTIPLSLLPAPLTNNPVRESSKAQQEIVIFHSTKLHQTSALATLVKCMSSTSPCSETFPPGHRCGPPKIVFFQNELEPPWKPHDTRYKAMSLEDKTRF